MNYLQQKIFAELPGTFRHKDVVYLARVQGRSRSWVYQTLDNWLIDGLVKRTPKNAYQKIGGEAYDEYASIINR